jgi:peroxiredoxin
MGRMQKRVFCGVACVAVTIAIVRPGVPATAAQSASPTVPKESAYALIPAASRVAAPDFVLTDVNGRKITLSRYRGKVVLLDFWAVNCGGCKVEIPWYVEFDHEYRSQGLRLIGIDMYGEKPEMIRPFMAKSGMVYPVAVGDDALGARFGLQAMPLTLLIDRGGRIAVSHAGIVDKRKFENDIQELLQSRSGQKP